MKTILKQNIIAAALAGLLTFTLAAQTAPSTTVLFQNVRIFDGKSAKLTDSMNVLIEGNTITKISKTALTPTTGGTVIDGGGRTLMPGLIDAHTHIMFATVPQMTLLTADLGYVNVAAVKAANEMLLRGFTSIRDLGGPVFGLKRGIDTGLVPGPRIWQTLARPNPGCW